MQISFVRYFCFCTGENSHVSIKTFQFNSGGGLSFVNIYSCEYKRHLSINYVSKGKFQNEFGMSQKVNFKRNLELLKR